MRRADASDFMNTHSYLSARLLANKTVKRALKSRGRLLAYYEGLRGGPAGICRPMLEGSDLREKRRGRKCVRRCKVCQTHFAQTQQHESDKKVQGADIDITRGGGRQAGKALKCMESRTPGAQSISRVLRPNPTRSVPHHAAPHPTLTGSGSSAAAREAPPMR